MSTKPGAGGVGPATRRRPRSIAAPLPQPVPVIEEEADAGSEIEQPFAEGARDALDPDLRYRMISEAAFGLYARRGFADGYDVEDWLAAEAEVDHLLLRRGSAGAEEGIATR